MKTPTIPVICVIIGALLAGGGCASGPSKPTSAYRPPYRTRTEDTSPMRMGSGSSSSAASAYSSSSPTAGSAVVDLRGDGDDEAAERRRQGIYEEDDIITLDPTMAAAMGLMKTEWKLSELRPILKQMGLEPVDADGNPY